MTTLGRAFFAWVLVVLLVAPAAAPPFRFRPSPHHEFETFAPRERGPGTGEHDAFPRNFDSELFKRAFPEWHQKQEIKKDLAKQMKADNPDSVVIQKLLNEYKQLHPFSKQRAAKEIVSLFEEASVVFEPSKYSTSSANLFVNRPKKPALMPVHDFAFDELMRPALDRKIDKDDLILLPFVDSVDGTVTLQKEVPLVWRARGGLMSDLQSGNFDVLDAHYFARLKGKTVFITGHIEIVDGSPAFEIRSQTDRSEKYLYLSQIESASAKIGFDYILLGCDTSAFSSMGTRSKINDIAALRAFVRLKRGGERAKTVLSALQDVSAPEIQLAIDVRKSTVRNRLEAAALPSASQYALSPGSSGLWAGAPAPGSIPNPVPNASPPTSAPDKIVFQKSASSLTGSYCDTDANVLRRSRFVAGWINTYANSFVTISLWGFAALCALAWLEASMQRAFGFGERIVTAAGINAYGAFYFFLALFAMAVATVHSYGELNPADDVVWALIKAVVIAGAFVVARRAAKDHVPDYKWVLFAASIILVWIALPPTIQFALLCFMKTCVIVKTESL